MNVIKIIIFLFIPALLFSGKWYVDNAASGTNAGTSWIDAWETWATVNWVSVGVDDTIYVSGGTVSKTYAQDPMNIGQDNVSVFIGQTAGHNGQAIFDGEETEDVELDMGGYQTVIVSGQVGSGSDCQLRFTRWDFDGVSASDMMNCEFAYLEVDNNGNSDDDDGFHISGVEGGGNSLHHCDIHDNFDDGISLTSGTADNSTGYKESIEVHHNEIYNLGGDGIIVGQGADGASFYDNIIHTQVDDDAQHSAGYTDGIQSLAQQYMEFYNNTFYDLAYDAGPNTANAGIFIECHVPHAINNIKVYNNVIYDNNSQPINHRAIQFKPTQATSITNLLIANNTVVDFNINGLRIGFAALNTGDITNFIIVNNLIYNCGVTGIPGDRKQWSLEGAGNWTCGDWGEGVDIIFDYNINGIYGAGTPTFDFKDTDYSYANFLIQSSANTNGWGGITPTFIDWAPHVAVDLSLAETDTSAIDKGVDLSDYFTVDRDGNTRSGTWDIGAYEYGAGEPAEPAAVKRFYFKIYKSYEGY